MNHSCDQTSKCLTPFYKKHDNDGDYYAFPCGKCPNCLKRRASGWSFRLMYEYRRSTSAYFMTYTYNTEHIPITKKGYMSLCKRDMQLYMKRLRKLHDKKHGKGIYRLKYYIVGEYGSKRKRPHYHMLIFNADKTLLADAWINPTTGQPIGELYYGEKFHEAAVGYCLKYMTKPPMYHHANDDRVPEFSLMSKGLGSNYITPNIINYHNEDKMGRMYCTIEAGKKLAMPRYYKNRIYDENTRLEIARDFGIEMRLLNELNEAEMRKKYGKDWKLEQVKQDKYKFEMMYKNSIKNDKL